MGGCPASLGTSLLVVPPSMTGTLPTEKHPPQSQKNKLLHLLGPASPAPPGTAEALCGQGAHKVLSESQQVPLKRQQLGPRPVETVSSAWLTSLDRHPCAAAPVDPPASTLGLWVKRFGLETCQFCLLLQSWNTGV